MGQKGFDFGNKIILITGGTGSWGQEFTRQLLIKTNSKEIRIYSRGEYHQVEMRRAFQKDSRVKFLLGDVRDKARLAFAATDVNVILHLAALKHVPVVEEHLWEALQTNTIGSHNVVEIAEEKRVDRVLFVSSDKAVDPLNFYGITKLAAERLMSVANQNGFATRFIVFRGGNVMGSAGSVIPVFRSQLLHENKITLTDPGMTRFFSSKQEMIELAIKALKTGTGGEIFIPKMKAATLDLLSRIMIEGLGNDQTIIERIDVRPGEKYHELLISQEEAKRSVDVSDMWVILPFFPSPALERRYIRAKRISFSEYRSDKAPKHTHQELRFLLEREGFLCREMLPTIPPLYFQKGHSIFH